VTTRKVVPQAILGGDIVLAVRCDSCRYVCPLSSDGSAEERMAQALEAFRKHDCEAHRD
jgi:hypothetical protein